MITGGPAHAAFLAALHAASFPPDEVWDETFLASQLAQHSVIALIAPACGFVLARVAADEAEILTLAVHPDSRRQGIGRALLDAAAGAVAAAGARTLYLEVSERNAAARYLYAAAGFDTAGRRARYYIDGSDALVLRRRLSPGATTGG